MFETIIEEWRIKWLNIDVFGKELDKIVYRTVGKDIIETYWCYREVDGVFDEHILLNDELSDKRVCPPLLNGCNAMDVRDAILKATPMNRELLYKSMASLLNINREGEEPKMVVITLIDSITNMLLPFGASAILYPKAQQLLKLDFPNGFWVLPSSVHETIVVEGEESDAPMYGAMVREINRCSWIIKTEDVLSDYPWFVRPDWSVYIYDVE